MGAALFQVERLRELMPNDPLWLERRRRIQRELNPSKAQPPAPSTLDAQERRKSADAPFALR